MNYKRQAIFGVLATAIAMAMSGQAGAAGLDGKVQAEVNTSDASPAVNGVIVRYRDGSAATVDQAGKLLVVNSAVSRAGLAKPATSGTRSNAMAATPKAQYSRRLAVGSDLIKFSRKLSRTETDNLIRELKADPSVVYAEPDLVMRAHAVPNDQYYYVQWSLSNPVGGINFEPVWETRKGEGVVVAVLDTGVTAHSDLVPSLLDGYDFLTDPAYSGRATSGRIAGGWDPGDWVTTGQCGTDETGAPSQARNSSWHGTHVAGIVAAAANNSIFFAGAASQAKILPLRVLGHCGGPTSDIADAIVWAAGGSVPNIPANTNPAEVINMSLGGQGTCGNTFQTAINAATGLGATVVASAGNSNLNASGFSPASCNNLISVAATSVTGKKAYYTNFGSTVDLSAPGGGGGQDNGGNQNHGFVFNLANKGTTVPTTEGLLGYIGTSQAAPHVAAVAALVQGALIAEGKDPLTPAAMETLLKQTARPFPTAIPTATPIGTGIVDAKAALDKALEEPCNPDVEQCGPVAIPLVNKVNVTGLSGAAGSEQLYSFQAEAGKVLSFISLGGTGNVSMYVSFEAEPTVASSDLRSTRPGNSETVRVTAPQAGTYYIKLVGTGAYSGVTLVARQ